MVSSHNDLIWENKQKTTLHLKIALGCSGILSSPSPYILMRIPITCDLPTSLQGNKHGLHSPTSGGQPQQEAEGAE